MGQLDLWPWKLLAVEGRLVGAIRFERTTTCTPSGPDLFLTCATAASWELLNGCNVTLGSMGCVPSYVPGGTVHAPDRLLQVTFRQVPVPPFHHGVIGPTADFAQVEQVPAAHDVVRRERVPQPVKRMRIRDLRHLADPPPRIVVAADTPAFLPATCGPAAHRCR